MYFSRSTPRLWTAILLYTNKIFGEDKELERNNYLLFIVCAITLTYGYISALRIETPILILLFSMLVLSVVSKSAGIDDILHKLAPVKCGLQYIGSLCGICLQNYSAESKVISLPCHNKYWLMRGIDTIFMWSA
eukprot:TRINITY_DN2280_c0_g2_i1.p3 TRINITY_DN2280_c0_g2~~TRINITY_DN2280_c0_g2_i1.p3  ORF type:complete len:134 (-),score=29.21 TRINITY_DN2280_c0_g2_i1:248-649(-)